MVESAAETMLGVVATGFLEAYLLMFRWATTWWLTLSMTPQALVGAVDSGFRATISYVAAFVLVLALLSAAIQTMWRRDGSVVADTAAGLFKAVLVIVGSWAVLGVLWTLADQLTDRPGPGRREHRRRPGRRTGQHDRRRPGWRCWSSSSPRSGSS